MDNDDVESIIATMEAARAEVEAIGRGELIPPLTSDMEPQDVLAVVMDLASAFGRYAAAEDALCAMVSVEIVDGDDAETAERVH